ncbi:MAG: polymer-forming cytoskeletal protein [Smithellaceae bacterium]|nr:polymer-forming cytoskeletal protein [Smithellaceae bacterium]
MQSILAVFGIDTTKKGDRMGRKDEDVKAFLGKGASFHGKLIFSEAVRIDGDFQGEIFGEGTLVIGEGAEIKAEIDVNKAIINGTVCGCVRAREKVEIHSTGHLSGNIISPKLVINEGAVFEGSSFMGSREIDDQ